MRPELKREIDRMKAILEAHGQPFQPVAGADPALIEKIERETGIRFDDDLKAFFAFSDGSHYDDWAAVMSDELSPLAFPDLADALEVWGWFQYDERHYEEWSAPGKVWHPAVQPAYLHHRLWFPIAEFNGYSTAVYYDADPTAEGRYGQIIVYQHDPDAIYYVAPSFLDFLRQSNDLLEAHAQELFG